MESAAEAAPGGGPAASPPPAGGGTGSPPGTQGLAGWLGGFQKQAQEAAHVAQQRISQVQVRRRVRAAAPATPLTPPKPPSLSFPLHGGTVEAVAPPVSRTLAPTVLHPPLPPGGPPGND